MLKISTTTEDMAVLARELKLRSRRNSIGHVAAETILALTVERDISRALLERYRAEMDRASSLGESKRERV